MRLISLFSVAALVCGSISVVLADGTAEPKPSTRHIVQAAATPPKPPVPVMAPIIDAKNVCAGQISPGWIKINDEWSPNSCGNPSAITYNVWVIEQYDNKPVGTVLQACSGPVPPGWEVIGAIVAPGACGHPTDFSTNIMTIRRMK